MTPLWGEGQTLTSHCQLGGVVAGLMDGRHPPAPASLRPPTRTASLCNPFPLPMLGQVWGWGQTRGDRGQETP